MPRRGKTPPPTEAQRNAANDRAVGRPSDYDQHPLSPEERHLVDDAQEQQLNPGSDR